MSIKTLSRFSPGNRVSTYYFVQAMSVGVVNAFAGIWFASKGISPEQIGFITAAPLVAILLIGVMVGRIADRAADWRQVIVWGALASGIIPVALLLAEGYWSILFVWTLSVTTQMAILPIVDAASIRLGRRLGFDFSRLYAWKTVGYMTTIFASGLLVVDFGISAFLPLFIGLSLVRAVAALSLPAFRNQEAQLEKELVPRRFLEVAEPWLLLPLVAWALVHSTHFVLNGFLGLLWQAQGLSEGMIGALIAMSSFAEIIMFFAFKHIARHFSARSLILASCVIAVVRWGALSLSPGIEMLFALQLLHAATYALGFLACTNFIAIQTGEDIAAEAQSFFAILQSGIAIFALLSFGWLVAQFGPYAFIISAGLAALGALLVVISMTLKK